MTAGGAARWIIASGQEVGIGDHVALALHPHSVGRIIGVAGDQTGAPSIELTAGPRKGSTVSIWPSDILRRVIR